MDFQREQNYYFSLFKATSVVYYSDKEQHERTEVLPATKLL